MEYQMGPSTSRSPDLVQRALPIVFFIGLHLMAYGCSSSQAEEGAPSAAGPPPASHDDGIVRIKDESRPFIEVEEVTADLSDSHVAAPARVDFRDGAVSQVGAPLEGRVQSVHVLVGQKVAAGDSLVTLDCPDAATLRASAEVAEASLREAKLELERQRRMQQEGVGTERELVAAETKVSSATAEVERVRSGAQSIGKGTASAVVVRAPIAGIVITRKASVGMAVQRGGDPLVEIGDASALWIVADVFERDLSRVHVGTKSRVRIPSVEHDLDGRVTAVGAVVGAGLRTAPVFMMLDRNGVALRPGMYGHAEIDASDAAVTLPVRAVLIKDGKDPVVYIQKDPLTYERRRVVLAQPTEGRVQIVSGVAPGEKVVVRGALLLDGAADQLL